MREFLEGAKTSPSRLETKSAKVHFCVPQEVPQSWLAAQNGRSVALTILPRHRMRYVLTGPLNRHAFRGVGGMSAPEQDYYWSAEWQRAEQEALAEIRRGEGVTFPSVEDAIQWLQEN